MKGDFSRNVDTSKKVKVEKKFHENGLYIGMSLNWNLTQCFKIM